MPIAVKAQSRLTLPGGVQGKMLRQEVLNEKFSMSQNEEELRLNNKKPGWVKR